jgi:hypothetical protein
MREDWVPGAATAVGTPFGISLAGGAAAMVGAALTAAGLVPAGATGWRLGVMALVVAGYTAMVDDAWASLATAGLGYLLFNGFLVNRAGELTWIGTTNVWQLGVFVVALGLGLGCRSIGRILARAALSAELEDLIHTLTRKKDPNDG